MDRPGRGLRHRDLLDFGGMLSQLGYTLWIKGGDGELTGFPLSYEGLCGTGGRWDYLTEDNAPACIAFFAEQIAYLPEFTRRVRAIAHCI
jgi:hypothetical protein